MTSVRTPASFADLIRERFGLDLKNSATASRLIKEAVTAGMVKPLDEAAAPKMMQYLPFGHNHCGFYLLGTCWNGLEADVKCLSKRPGLLRKDYFVLFVAV